MIRGELTYLRAVEPKDLELLYSWENNPKNWLVSGLTTPFSENTLKKYIESIHDIYTDKQLRLVICTKENREVGIVDLFDFNPTHGRAGLGILIHNERDRNTGFAKDALNEIIKYSFETLHLEQVYCSILENNTASINLFEGLGFIRCGEKKHWVKSGERFLSEFNYQLIRKEA